MCSGIPHSSAASPSTLDASKFPCPPTATMTNRLVSISFSYQYLFDTTLIYQNEEMPKMPKLPKMPKI
jgi:hypothetical protein